jgi:hypothetical protein
MLLVVLRFKLCLLFFVQLSFLVWRFVVAIFTAYVYCMCTHTRAWDSCIFLVCVRDRLIFSLVLQKLRSLW